ncbi:MAG: hypothetical protein IV097_06955 [Burkholderiaceae bacterium]|nr:hypothetical protein [Burkholderiaceae bacterium]
MLQFLSAKRHAAEPAVVALATKPVEPTQTAVQAAIPVVEHHYAWFDSSRELKAGLLVQELPFSREDWLALSGQRLQ